MFVATDVVVFFAFISVCFSRTVVHTIEDLMEKSLIYDYDRHHNRPYYCEFASEKQIHEGNTGTSGNPHVSFKCMDQNPDMIWNVEGEQYFPFYGYSQGKNGRLLRCGGPPENVTLTNCTAGDLVYSKCQYSCPGDFSNENLGTTGCSIVGAMKDIAVRWTDLHCSLFSRKGQAMEEDDNDSILKTIIPVAAAAVFLVLAAVVIYILVRRKSQGVPSIESSRVPSVDTIVAKGEGQIEGEGGEKKDECEALLQNGRVEMENAVNGAAKYPQMGMAEFQDARDIRNSKVFGDGEKETDLNEIEKKLDEPMGSLRDLLPSTKKGAAINSGSQQDLHKPSAVKENGSEDDDKCTTCVSLLIEQSQNYMDEFAILTEVVGGKGETNTMMGLARTLSIYSYPRGVDVAQSYPKPYTGEEKPALGHLQNMSAHGIFIGRLVEYFTVDDIIDHILSVHIGCGYCTKVAEAKKCKTVKLATKVL